MKHVVVLGAGTAGTMLANRLARRTKRSQVQITVVDQDDVHEYQPGFLLLPFGRVSANRLQRHRRALLHPAVTFVLGEVDRVDTAEGTVLLADSRRLPYDYLVVATGTSPRPDQTPGLLGPAWRHSIFDFYTLDGARALADALSRFEHGRLVVHITEMPIKCPVAPLEFAFLADDYLLRLGRRPQVDITYVTPLSGAFTKPIAAARLGAMLDQRDIAVETDFVVEEVDPVRRVLTSYDGRQVPFDLLVTVPLNMGADFVARSGLGDELNYVPVDPATFRSRAHANVFAVGDANDIPTSKAGSVAHFSVDVLTENLSHELVGEPATASFDGHANCFIESGRGRGLLIDFNYDTEPLPGRYPVPRLGPLRLLGESRANHLGKLAFRWIYWNVLLPGRPIPLRPAMSMAGKVLPKEETTCPSPPSPTGKSPSMTKGS